MKSEFRECEACASSARRGLCESCLHNKVAVERLTEALEEIAGDDCRGCLIDYAYAPGECLICIAKKALGR